MALVSIQEFADSHGVTPQAVWYRIKKTKKLKAEKKHGIYLINDRQKCDPFRS